MRRFAPTFLLPLALAVHPAAAQPADTLRIRVVDVGAGLCTITRTPGGAVMVYDAGHWQGGRCFAALDTLVRGDTINLMILSHNDSDHLGDVPAILNRYTVRRIVWTGFRRPGVATWERADSMIAREVWKDGASVRSLASHPLTPGDTIRLGDAVVTLLAGWHEWRPAHGLSEAELRNAVSIVARLDYGGASVLYAGDTVGRQIGESAGACGHPEAVMVANHVAGSPSLRADVLIAPHHGADNASAACFIAAVDPRWVIFSAGHAFSHPRAATAERYLAHGVPAANLLRTDRGDDEGPAEWSAGRVPGCSDRTGDDHVEITVVPPGVTSARYVTPSTGC